jgi:CRP-like cAMP-binding protein
MEPIEWLPATLRDYATERKLAARQILFSEGDASAGVYEVVSGKVKLEQTDVAGRVIVLGFASAGDTIAEASVFAPSYRCDATAMKESVVRMYPKAALLAEFERNPKAARAFMGVLARRVVDLRNRLERRSLHLARDRVRHYLGHSGQPTNRTVVLSGSLKDLAAELGLTHEVLYRTLSEMEAEGEIVRRQCAITVVGPSYDSDHMSLSHSRL